jgi:hypothetical protein
MKKFIVITSIYNPTEAVIEFSSLSDCELIVVGDKKTPDNWSCISTKYLSLLDQKESNYSLASILPYNHYSRKMVGYLYAIENNADFIIDSDDDNIPKEKWGFPKYEGQFDTIRDKGFVNIYSFFTKQKIWPRGLPLQMINSNPDLHKNVTTENSKIGIWQGLADGDPDVDAIYRLTDNTPCNFEDREPIVLSKGTISPFNSQNTIFIKELFPLLYLPTFVTFRFTDILRGLVAQPIMWLYDYQLGFTKATVVQKRNPHDYMKDFVSEIPMYENCEKVIDVVTKAVSLDNTMEENLLNAYRALLINKIIIEKELETLEAWLLDLSKLK